MNITMEGELWVNQTELEDAYEMEADDGGGHDSTTATIAALLIVFALLSNMTLIMATVSKVNAQEPLGSVHLLFRLLAIVNLLVSSVFLPTLMGWINLPNFTYESSWVTGDRDCRIVAFLNSVGLYLSGHLVACITMDRYMAILKPTDAWQTIRRAKIMLFVTLLSSGLCSAPEAILHHMEAHPVATWLTKCAISGSFRSREAELVYISVQMMLTYGVPVTTVMICYLGLFRKIPRMNAADIPGQSGDTSNHMKTLKLSLASSATFAICWAPYYVIGWWSSVNPTFTLSVRPNLEVFRKLITCVHPCCSPVLYSLLI